MTLLDRFRRWFGGERRQKPRMDPARVDVVNRQYAAASRLARKLGTTPEALMDYRRADRILGSHR